MFSIGLGDINNASKNLKSFLITFTTLPFWYICIYIYFPELYVTKDYLLIFCFCFCLNLLCTIIISAATVINLKEAKHILEIPVSVLTVQLHTFYLTIWILLTYSYSLVFNEIFYFFPFFFIFIGLLLIIEILSYYQEQKKAKE